MFRLFEGSSTENLKTILEIVKGYLAFKDQKFKEVIDYSLLFAAPSRVNRYRRCLPSVLRTPAGVLTICSIDLYALELSQ